MKLRAGIAFGLVVLALLACKKKEEASSSSSTTTTSANAVGVPECDDYLNKYETCVKEKMPEAARAATLESIKGMREQWKKLADNPVTKGSLAQVCTQSKETTKTAMAAYGCTF
jgi:hypothetical protein